MSDRRSASCGRGSGALGARCRLRPWGIVPAILMLAWTATSSAKPPTLDHLFPAGGSRGSVVEVTATGQFERWPVRVWTSSPGLSIQPRSDKGKLTITIASDAAPGFHWIRLFDDDGATTPRPFLVGTLPEVNEVEPNDETSQAQRVDPAGVIVNGRLGKPGDVDGFRVTLQQGQTLVVALEANRTLGSPMDGLLQIASSAGFVLAQNDDDLDRDPRIAFQAPSDGDYLIRAFAFPFIQDSTIRFAGNPSYVYRLTISTGGVSDHAFPLSVTRGSSTVVEPIGWNIPDVARRLVVEPSDDDGPAWISHLLLTNPVEVQRVDEPSVVEVEPNDRSQPQPIVWPVALTGRIERPGDVDIFSFAAKKNETLVIRVGSRALGLPLDAVLRVGDASGVTIVEVDDAQKAVDPEIRFTPPADGTYRVEVRDLNGHGGANFAYLLTIAPPRPDFRLTMKADPIAIKPGPPFDLVVQVDRQEGFAEAIEVGLSERFDGLIAESVVSKPTGPTAKSVTLKLRVCDCLKPGPIQVEGIALDGRRKRANVPVPGLNRTIDTAWVTLARPTPPKPEIKDAPPAK